MADKIEYSRMLVKRTDQTGEVPTVPPVTAVTLNQMIPTDLFVGEFFLNQVDDLLWIRTDNGILPISLSGSTGTTATPTLTQVLFEGNVTNGYNIDVSAGDTIVFNGLTTGSTTDILGIDASGNTIVTSVTGSTVIIGGDYLPLSGGTVTGDTTFTQDLFLTNLTSGGSQTILTVDSDTGQVYTATNFLNPYTGNVQIVGQSWVKLPNTGTTTSATTINWNSGNIQEVTLGANTTFTFSNPNAGATYILIVKQSSGGGNTITFPGTVTWSGGSTPTMTSTSNRFDVFTFIYDGTRYFGTYAQNFI